MQKGKKDVLYFVSGCTFYFERNILDGNKKQGRQNQKP